MVATIRELNPTLASILVGTLALDAALVASFLLSRRPLRGSSAALLPLAGLTLVLHAAHVVEEWSTGMFVRYPELLGLVAWPEWFFVAFNLGWIFAFAAALPTLRGQRARVNVLVWFMAVAGTLNAVAHPLLCVADGGYFPGIVTALLVGPAGVVLLKRLLAATTGPK